MTTNRPAQITAHHLVRKAAVYIRQNGDTPLRPNDDRIASQRGQVGFPTRWGWPPDLIEIIDDDLGLSGSTTVTRAGYRRMVADVAADRIGAIFIADVTRATRNARDWVDLIETCQRHGVLVVIDGQIYDPRDIRHLWREATGQ
jgi:DNA invertase Pin-like site-specific DNA recombinase